MKRENEVININVEEIIPNRFQPRLSFDAEALEELSNSIKQYGVFQPLVVRKIGNKYEIIAGERRYKASVQAGFKEVPCLVVELDDDQSAEVALVENLQRKDLTPIEEAKSYKKLLEKGYLTQEQLAKKMGKSQSAVANKIRLLNLDQKVQQALIDSQISERHARSLLSLKESNEQQTLLNKIITNRMTVKETDEEVKKMITEENQPKDFIPYKPTLEPTPAPALPVQDIKPEIITIDELSKVDSTNIEEKPKTVIPEETTPEEIEYIDIEKLTRTAEDLNKQEPKPDIMDLLKTDGTGSKPNVPEALYQTAPEIPVVEVSQPEVTPTIPTVSVDQIPTAMEATIPENPVLTNEPLPPTIDFTNPLPENNVEAPSSETPPPIITTNEIPIIGQEPVKEFVFVNPQQPVPEETVVIEEPNPSVTSMNITNNLRTAINTARECVNTIEKYGVPVDKEELDMADYYQITIRIDKVDKTAA